MTPAESSPPPSVADCFQLLGVPRRPWLDRGMLKSRFLALSAEVHPDRVHGGSEKAKQSCARRFAELNAAFKCLDETKDRLRHLLELEQDRKPAGVQSVPAHAMELFADVGEALRGCDLFLRERESATLPLLRAQLTARGLEWVERLGALQARFAEMSAALESEVRDLDAAWRADGADGAPARAGGDSLARLDELYRTLSYVSRWSGRLRERIVQLAM